MDDYLSKPVRAVQLREMLDTYLGLDHPMCGQAVVPGGD